MPEIDIQQRHAEHCTVGGDKRQKNPQQTVKHRAGFAHHHLGELHDHSNHQNKCQGAQVNQIKWDQNPRIDKPGANRRQRHHKRCCQPHAHRGFQFFGNPHKRTETEKLDQYKVIDQYSSDKQ
ncbi:Uncharacterised protein [Shigella sonnei]|nr:hypothetical protein DP20_3712 [Shigella flexneri]CSF44915.1 Uncharacterised protein [Shigella sonnei]CSG12820.1 Uncharacterised protein [Shigella sonnei]CSG39520.1 Uncharacterised protein [Shigella sonnei]CSP93124.1 Uncharacterised protein [Shigella sonnei]